MLDGRKVIHVSDECSVIVTTYRVNSHHCEYRLQRLLREPGTDFMKWAGIWDSIELDNGVECQQPKTHAQAMEYAERTIADGLEDSMFE